MAKPFSLRRLIVSYLAGVLAVLAFVALSAVALVWANGLKFNITTWDFEKTVLIAISADLEDVIIKINNQEISKKAPIQQRNLLPGKYDVKIEKSGFITWEQTFWLGEGQVGLIKQPVLIANNPLVSTSLMTINWDEFTRLDSGLTLNNGELQDRGVFITRFSQSPIQVHRMKNGYVYQNNDEFRVFFSEGNHDFLLFKVQDSTLHRARVYESTWQLAVEEANNIKVVNLLIPSDNTGN